jgi:hypothetical protein
MAGWVCPEILLLVSCESLDTGNMVTMRRPFSPANSRAAGFLQQNRNGQENGYDSNKACDDHQRCDEFLNDIEFYGER